MAKGRGRVVRNRKRMAEAKAEASRLLRTVAFQMQAHAMTNIRTNNQIDTGFMVNSGFVALDGGESTYGQGMPAGTYTDREGHATERRHAPARHPPREGAVVGFSAEYAYWQERRRSFLMKAAEQTAHDFEGLHLK